MHNIFKHSRVLSQEDDCSTTSRISGDIRRQRLTSRRSIDKAHSEAEMDEAGQQKGVTAAFPPPPAFWKHFSQHNLDKLEELKRDKEAAQDGEKVDWSPEALAGLDVPPELQCLIPPKLPEHEFLLFGESQLVRLAMIGLLPKVISANITTTACTKPSFASRTRHRTALPLQPNRGRRNRQTPILPRLLPDKDCEIAHAELP